MWVICLNISLNHTHQDTRDAGMFVKHQQLWQNDTFWHLKDENSLLQISVFFQSIDIYIDNFLKLNNERQITDFN